MNAELRSDYRGEASSRRHSAGEKSRPHADDVASKDWATSGIGSRPRAATSRSRSEC